jgi:MFS transporter, DHA1 family, tetracycline resistance protein
MPMKKRQRRIFLTLYALTILDTIIAFLLYSFLPDFLSSVSGNKQVWLSVLFGIFIGCQLISAPVLGYIGDQFGRRPVFLFATIATFFAQLYLLPRLLGGIVLNRLSDGMTNGIYSTTRSAITDISTTEEAPQRLGFIEAISSLGIILGPAVATVLLFLFVPRGFQSTTIIVSAAIVLSFINVCISLSIPETNKQSVHHFRFYELVRIIVQQVNPFQLFRRVRLLAKESPALGRLLFGVFFIGGAMGYYSYFIVFLSQGALQLTTERINQLMLVLGCIIFIVNTVFFRFIYKKISTWNYMRISLLCGIFIIPAYGLLTRDMVSLIVLFIIDSCTFSLSLSLLNGFVASSAPENKKGEAFGVMQGVMALSGFLTVIVYTALTAINITLPYYWFAACLVGAYIVIFFRQKHVY